ncbi:MAG TPA: cytochrome C [Sedimenticola thiotaurini]|uniref:Cytochrome C n=1 Tax=Sedimenticola thiotaurini TaxID=1543721 RepID=A0A831WAW9_9GAMM|nr:cytochrome C [Sedimenticola thiotaurini]
MKTGVTGVLAGLILITTGAVVAAEATSLPAVPEGPYRSDCGRCHLAYPAGLLPALSWERIMLGLTDHFGEQVQLSPQSTRAIYDYLLTNAAGRVTEPLSIEVMNQLGGDPAPQRITGTPFFRSRHDTAAIRQAGERGAVKSMADCAACHPRAGEASFDAGEVQLP